MADLSGAVWHKSTRSGGNGGDCVEVAGNLPGIVALRDTKDPDGATLIFSREQWHAFLAGVRAGEFDHRAR
ncbi:hypothetical protein ACWT_6250 [Actinoplanes sp. SE50]|uniref:DUF397 domain-containing protein n=1 Tax=unclassified Actinoplanes TaxID=2626549 RepID=UPI00023ED126|nr:MULTISPECIES: DUF397 domain-containing protein [unclassified Actinoplanes]AEV87265.1 hypothetical protein ACPL_6383 [Actinoplanes sp. SE50/110]ATO85665.1 hypothetical protein ACWT_6250 [Actinoplanes sp. SE50]SLM03078.1 hypothetical protein ACSP50_6367 [Actinoplanes sp. SE50/110]